MNEDLTFETDERGHLVANPPHKRHALTTLCFTPDGVLASAGSTGPILLDWDSYGRMGPPIVGEPPQDGWIIDDWVGRGIGVAVRVSGSCELAGSDIVDATSTVWRRFESGPGKALTGRSLTGRSLPVLIGHTVFTASAPEYDVLGALCKVVRDDPRLRLRLGDVNRMARLAIALNITRPTVRATPKVLDRDSVDIHAALIGLGFTHRYSRPLSTTGLPALAEVTDKVVAALSANPYRAGRVTPRAQVERFVRRDYLDVEPWPFTALVQD